MLFLFGPPGLAWYWLALAALIATAFGINASKKSCELEPWEPRWEALYNETSGKSTFFNNASSVDVVISPAVKNEKFL